MAYRLVRTISGKGSRPEQFAAVLRAVAVDRAGRVYAVGDRDLKVFAPDGTLVHRWSTSRPGYCVFVEQAEAGVTVWVGESGVVERFDGQGRGLGEFRDGERLGTVTAIGLHGDDVLLGDATARCIRRYSRAGQWLADIGRDNNTKGFVIPNGVVDFRVEASGVIRAINPAKHRIERYSRSGELLGRFGKFGMTRPEDFGGCCNPTNITLLSRDRFAVTEKAPPRLKIYSDQGSIQSVVGPEGFDENCKNMALATDETGRIYVVDTERLCILVFAPEESTATATAPATPGAVRGEDER